MSFQFVIGGRVEEHEMALDATLYDLYTSILTHGGWVPDDDDVGVDAILRDSSQCEASVPLTHIINLDLIACDGYPLADLCFVRDATYDVSIHNTNDDDDLLYDDEWDPQAYALDVDTFRVGPDSTTLV